MAIDRVLFVGSKALGLRVLERMHALSPATLVGAITIDDRTDTRSALDGFQSFAHRQGLALHVAADRKDSERTIREMRPDLCLVVGWYWLVSAECIASVPHGLIGIHYSPLPRFRGGSPLVWQMITGQRSASVSFFSLTPGMDDGPIWMQESVAIERTDYVGDVLRKLEVVTLRRLGESYRAIIAGELQPAEQRHADATYCAQRTPEDGRIEWSRSADDVYNFIRAQSDPYPGAFTDLDGAVMRVWRARPFHAPYYGIPGRLARAPHAGIVAICGDHRGLLLEEVELDGVRGNAAQLIRSVKSRLSTGATH